MLSVKADPYDYQFPEAHTALVVIDMQRDFVEPGGQHPVSSDTGSSKSVESDGSNATAWCHGKSEAETC